MNLVSKIKQELTKVLAKLNITEEVSFVVEIPKDNTNGDYATNVAMQLTRLLRKNPRMIASEIVENAGENKYLSMMVDDERKGVNDKNHKPVSIGIISPFRAQVEQLKISVSKVLSEHMMEKHKIEIGTAHTFQGDERDIMLISWAYAQNSYPQSLIFLQKPNLFNVAITRARHKLINFISRDINELPEGLLRNYLEYVKKNAGKEA